MPTTPHTALNLCIVYTRSDH